MALITNVARSGKTEVSVATADPSGAVAGDLQLAFNTASGRFFYRDNTNNWRRYEEGVVLRATGVGATDTANLISAAAASNKVLIDDRDAPLVLDQGSTVSVGDCFLQSRHGMARINLSNNTQLIFGTSINVASHGSWADCTVSTDNDTITSATLANAAAGDLILVVAENLIATVEPHFAGGSTRPHEISTISRIVGTNFYLGKRLVDTYTTTPKCALLKMSGAGGLATLSTRAGMANIDFTGSTNSSWGSNSTGIIFYTAYRPIVENVILRDTGSMILQSTLGAQVRGVYIDSQTNGYLDYGIALTGSDDTVIDGMIAHRCRHVITTSAQASGTARYGTLRRPMIRNAEAWSAGYDTAEYSTTFTVDAQDQTNDTVTLTTPGGVSLGSTVALTTTGSLPTTLSATNYFVRSISGSRIQLTLTAGGAPVAINSAGSGTHTMVKKYSASNNETNIVFDTHPEGYEVTFEDCTAHLVGPSSLAGTGAGGIGFGTRSRGTIWRRCRVYGDTTQKHRGFKISSCPNTRLEHCYMKGGWVGVHSDRTGAPNSDAIFILGGRFENLTNDGMILDGGIAHIIDGVSIESVGSSSTGIVGSQRACIAFHDADGVGFGFSIVRNCFLPKTTNLYSIGIGGYLGGPQLTSSMIQLYNNRMPDYDHGQIGINRTLANAIGIEVRWAGRQDTYHPHTHIQQTAHGLVIANKYAPITDAHDIYDPTLANQLVVGILADVFSVDAYVLLKQGEDLELPISMMAAGSGYTLAAGRDLYYSQALHKWQPTLPAGAHGDARAMLRADAIEDSVVYCRVGAPTQISM